MHATHQFFMTERSLYLLVVSGRDGNEDADVEYWLKHIEAFGRDSPVIVVQNKINEHQFELNYRGLQARYPQVRAFIKTDCKEDVGLDILTEKIRSLVDQMSEIMMPFPASWFRVKSRLEAMNSDFMSFEKFCDLCKDEGIRSDEDEAALAWALHCLGIALNYRDDWRLRETSVLKPQWVTTGIYSLINAEALAARHGELHLRDLKEVLPNDKYPPEKHYYILELMRKFSLCFPFYDETDRYLVPDALGKEEPEEARDFHPAECLNFEYQYEVLPDGLIPRFIVRSHPLSRGQPRWRSGAILVHEGCKALLAAEYTNRRITIRVMGGDTSSRRNLLAIIRYDLDRIAAEFKNLLGARPQVPVPEYPGTSIEYKKLVTLNRDGIREFHEVIGDRTVTLKVKKLLEGVDIRPRRGGRMHKPKGGHVVFFSYSHKDELLRDQLETHLKLMQREGLLATWHDRKIMPGSEWDGEINSYLSGARIILLLTSADFLASDYCWGTEVTMALERHDLGEAVVMPIIIRQCDWRSAPFGRLQALPKDGKPVTSWKNRDAAWADVAAGLRRLAETL
jgi:internalin A